MLLLGSNTFAALPNYSKTIAPLPLLTSFHKLHQLNSTRCFPFYKIEPVELI